MSNHRRLWAFFLGILFLGATASVCRADFKPHSLEAGIEVFQTEYEASGLKNMRGPMVGFSGVYAYRSPYQLVLKAEFSAGFGQADYESAGTGSLDGADHRIYEARGLLGYVRDFDFGSLSVRAFAGAGFGRRNLVHDSSGMESTTGQMGYKREFVYDYTPIEIEALMDLGGGWSLAFSAEYDFFWRGEHIRHVGQAYPSLNRVRNIQDSGYGLRGSLKIIKTGPLTVVFEPFIRHWNIDQSTRVSFDRADPSVDFSKFAFEPQSETTEIGLKVCLLF
jgi:hypothetical protein